MSFFRVVRANARANRWTKLHWAAAGCSLALGVSVVRWDGRLGTFLFHAPLQPVAAAPIPIGGPSSTGAALKSAPPVAEDGLCSLIAEKTSAAKLRDLLSGARSQYINVHGMAGVTPLMIAAYMGQADVVNTLLDFGADTDVDTVAPRSVIQFKSYFDPYQPQGVGLRAIDFAILGGHPDVIVTLIERGKSDPTLPRTIKVAGAPMRNSDGMVVASQDTKTLTLDSRLEVSWRVLSSPTFEAKEEAKSLLRSAIKRGKALRDERVQKYRQQFPLEARLAEQLVGQQPAIQAVSSAIRRKENGWVDADSPLVMLFMGSSGIGKTRTAKLIGEYLHSGDTEKQSSKTSNDCFIRIDMSEFQHKHEVSKFIGSPPGYVGYESGGQLVSKLEKCPNAVVLLDEVEKAHPDVLTVMLQAFDEGRLTDGKGKTIDCSDAVFVLTSNLAQREIADEAVRLRQHKFTGSTEVGVEAGVDPLTKAFKRDVVQPILRRHFGRDEFIGRINEILFFLPFTEEEQRLLANKELQAWAKRAKAKQGIELTWSPEVCEVAAEEYDLRYGARSIKYEIDRMCIAPIARAQEEGVVKAGCKVHIDIDRRVVAQLKEMAKEHEKVKRDTNPPPMHVLRPQLAAEFSNKSDHTVSQDSTAPTKSATQETTIAAPANSYPLPTPLPGATLYRGGKVALSVFPPSADQTSGKGAFSRLLGL